MTLNMLERQRWQLAWDSFRLIAVAATVVLGATLGLGAIQLLTVFAVVSASAYAVHILLCYRAITLCQRNHCSLNAGEAMVATTTY
jgi:hypothetical protein